ncbi:MAG: J domain-containing protein [Proteobacteria bacterium]|nr:J domain-containing protein [Pseudomonadota bacterium]
MNKIFWGKIAGLVLPLMMGKSMAVVVVCVCVGHIFDEAIPSIKVKVLRKLSYQKVSEEFLFLMAYFVMFLGLSEKKAFRLLQNECKINKGSEKNIEDLFFYYTDEYLVRHGRNPLFLGKRITFALNTLKFTKDDQLNFFRIVENFFDSLIKLPTTEDIAKLKRVAKILDVDYIREEKAYGADFGNANSKFSGSFNSSFGNKDHAKTNNSQQQYSYKNKNSSNNTKSFDGILTLDVKKAFKVLGVREIGIKTATLKDVKKAYKDSVKKYHPDFVNGKKVSEKK